ncbi:MAG: IS1182 family transposase [Actinobacteria bacterium]|nr:MAG: IS1182 family transposase [Actinomycetota bacterium]
MVLGRVKPQGSLLETRHMRRHLVTKGSFYERLADHGDEIVTDDDFADLYAPRMGRPSIPPSVMVRAMLCATHDKTSDEETSRRSRVDADWKAAMGVDDDFLGIGATTFSLMRARMLAHDADATLFEKTLQKAVAKGILRGKLTAIIDSSPVHGAGAVADTYELIRAAIAKLVAATGGPKVLPSRLRKDARTAVRGKAVVDWADATARRAELDRLVGLARALLALPVDDAAAEARELLARIVGQDVTDTDDGPAIGQGVAADRVVSVVDPEMRHGRKSSSKRVDGYKAHVLTDHDSELILGVSVTPANDPDGPEAAPLVAAARGRGVPVAEVLGDTAYGDGDTRVAVEAAGAKITAKTQPPPSTGRFVKTDFTIDPDTPSATCPAGHVATHTTTSRDHKGRKLTALHFGAEICGACPLRERCTTNPKGRSITLNFHEARLQAARAEQTRASTRRKLRRRALVERKLAETKRHGAGKARYRGTRKVLLQQRLTAAMVNLKRLFTIDPTFGAPSA